MTERQWTELRQELYFCFPRVSKKNLDNILDSFKEADKNNNYTMVPYVLNFNGITLRVGVRVPNQKIMSYVPTPAYQELEALLNS